MEVVSILEKHKNDLSIRLNDNILNGIKDVIYSDLNINFLDTVLDIIFLFACAARVDEDNYQDFCEVINFFLDSDVRRKDYYKELLNDLKLLLSNSSELDKTRKIKTIIMIIKSKSFNGDYSIIKRIMFQDIHYIIYEFLKRLFEFGGFTGEKLEIILDEILNVKINYPRCIEDNQYIIFILSSKIACSLDNASYRDLVKVCFVNDRWYLFYNLLLSNISSSKKKIAFSYYLNIIIRMGEKFHLKNGDKLKQDIFMVVFSLEYNDNESYRNKLNEILNAQNSSFYAQLINSNISLEYRKIALNYQYAPAEKDGEESNKYIGDAATALLLKHLPVNDYNNLLAVIKKLTDKLLALEDEDEKKIIRFKIEALLKIFNCDFYKYNLIRLEYLIRSILSLKDIFAINEIGCFGSHFSSQYYSDDEFMRVIMIFQNTSVIGESKRLLASKYFLFYRLFTNSNIPDMDKEILFEIADNCDSEAILAYIQKLNSLGIQNYNIKKILGEDSQGLFLSHERAKKLLDN